MSCCRNSEFQIPFRSMGRQARKPHGAPQTTILVKLVKRRPEAGILLHLKPSISVVRLPPVYAVRVNNINYGNG